MHTKYMREKYNLVFLTSLELSFKLFHLIFIRLKMLPTSPVNGQSNFNLKNYFDKKFYKNKTYNVKSLGFFAFTEYFDNIFCEIILQIIIVVILYKMKFIIVYINKQINDQHKNNQQIKLC